MRVTGEDRDRAVGRVRLADAARIEAVHYRKCAVAEMGRKVGGSSSLPPSAELAWINHYHHKSDEDYFEKAARKSVQDAVGIRFETRSTERHLGSQKHDNTVFDDCAVRYYVERCRRLSIAPTLLQQRDTPTVWKSAATTA